MLFGFLHDNSAFAFLLLSSNLSDDLKTISLSLSHTRAHIFSLFLSLYLFMCNTCCLVGWRETVSMNIHMLSFALVYLLLFFLFSSSSMFYIYIYISVLRISELKKMLLFFFSLLRVCHSRFHTKIYNERNKGRIENEFLFSLLNQCGQFICFHQIKFIIVEMHGIDGMINRHRRMIMPK